jgi:NADH-quinone oxidoreductase subunit J
MSLGQLFFGVCAVASLVGALSTILAKNPIRSAMGLLLTIAGITGLYVGLHAQLLAALQLIVYAGAVVILFVFVIMLLGPDATSPADSKAAFWRYGGSALFALAAIGSGVLLVRASGTPTATPDVGPDFGGIEAVGRTVFTTDLVAFEMISLLFIVAIVGAVAVARGKQEAPKRREETP